MSKIASLENDCQIIHYFYEFPTKTRFVYLEHNSKLIEAYESRASIKLMEAFYWQENLSNPNPDPMALRLDCKYLPDGSIEIELKPEIARSLKFWNLKETWFTIFGKGYEPAEPITMEDIGSIWVDVRLEHGHRAIIRDGKLVIQSSGDGEIKGLPDDYYAHGRSNPKIKGSPEPEPTREKEKPKKKEKANVLHLPEYPKPTKEIWEWCKSHYGPGEWKRILRGLNKFCLYRERREDKHYPGKSERKNRQYVYGQQWLADKLGITRRNVRKWLYRFEADGVIYYPYKGYRGRGASICELAYCEGHRRMNKRKSSFY